MAIKSLIPSQGAVAGIPALSLTVCNLGQMTCPLCASAATTFQIGKIIYPTHHGTVEMFK